MAKLAKYLIDDLKGDWSKPSIKFFRSNSSYGYIIWLTIMDNYYRYGSLPIEALVGQTERYASRRTILDFVNKGVDAGFIEKKNSNDDRRKFFIHPTKITVQEYNEWSAEFIKNIT